jgi:hypothetical protein
MLHSLHIYHAEVENLKACGETAIHSAFNNLLNDSPADGY